MRVPSKDLCTVESHMWGIEDCHFIWVQKRNYSIEDDLPDLRWTYTPTKHINLPNFEHFSKSKYYKNQKAEGAAAAATATRTRAGPSQQQMADPYFREKYFAQSLEDDGVSDSSTAEFMKTIPEEMLHEFAVSALSSRDSSNETGGIDGMYLLRLPRDMLLELATAGHKSHALARGLDVSNAYDNFVSKLPPHMVITLARHALELDPNERTVTQETEQQPESTTRDEEEGEIRTTTPSTTRTEHNTSRNPGNEATTPHLPQLRSAPHPSNIAAPPSLAGTDPTPTVASPPPNPTTRGSPEKEDDNVTG